MTTPDFNATVTMPIKAPVEKVWEALTNPTLVKQYLHDTTVISDWKVGSPIRWQGVWKGQTYEDKGIILELEPNKLLKTTHWSPLSGAADLPENYHVVTYELSAEGDKTRLTLTQSNNPSQEAVEAMAKNGWQPILQKLKALVET